MGGCRLGGLAYAQPLCGCLAAGAHLTADLALRREAEQEASARRFR